MQAEGAEDKPKANYKVGHKCLATWLDSDWYNAEIREIKGVLASLRTLLHHPNPELTPVLLCRFHCSGPGDLQADVCDKIRGEKPRLLHFSAIVIVKSFLGVGNDGLA